MTMSLRPKGLIGELSQSRKRLLEAHLSGLPAAVVVQRCTDWVEGVIRRLFAEAAVRYPEHRPVGVAAVGGFGRGELNLQSDVDLLFLYPQRLKADLARLAQQVLYPLWDLKLDVGHAARTIDECLQMAESDFSVLVSLLTMRTVAGSPEPAQKLNRRLAALLASPAEKKKFLDRIKAADRQRQERFGHTPYLLEPHVKESEGGLREIHTITWLGLGCFGAGRLGTLAELGLLDDEEVAFVGETREFLWRIRNHLHYLAGGRDDRLTFERQEKVAEFLGFKDSGGLSRVEGFMREYYTRAFNLRNIRDIFVERAEGRLSEGDRKKNARRIDDVFLNIGGKLHLADPERVKSEPALMMKLFAVSAASGIKVSHQARQRIRLGRRLVDDAFRRDPGIRRDFYQVLMAARPESGALAALHGGGLLNAYLPELEDVFQLPQHDAYHIYTVDVHQIRTVGRLNELKSGQGPSETEKLAGDLLNQLSRPRLLYLAALLHDLGKGGGTDHAARGAALVWPALARLGLTEEEAGLVSFLIENHLLLMQTATRRDFHDEKLLFQLAREIGDEERLAMLFLLTVADSKATGPQAWSSWLSTLLRELYYRVLATLTRTDIDYLGSKEWLDELKATVAGLLKGRMDAAEIDRQFNDLPDQYLLTTAPDTIAEQLVLQDRLKGRLTVFEVKERPEVGYCQITVVARRRRGLFSRMAGVLTLNGLNILGAQVHSRRDGVSTHVFQTEFPTDPLGREEKWASVERDMDRALSGKLALEVRVARRKGQTRRGRPKAPRRPVEIKVDNTVSDFHTVIEVAAHDRLGLLYDITRIMFELDLEIHLAKVSTKVDQIYDVFYVTDRDGVKVRDEEQIEEIKEALKAILE